MIALSLCCDCFKVANMTTPAKRKRITVIASQDGVEIAKRSLSRLGFDSKDGFAKAQTMGKSTVDKFFNRKGIQLDSFKRICEGLTLTWSEILEQDISVNPINLNSSAPPIASKPSGLVSDSPGSLRRESACSINTVNEEIQITNLEIVLKGDFNSINNEVQQAIEILLRNGFGSAIRIVDIQPGSIRITIQGNKEDIVRLVDRFTSGELSEINGFAVEELQARDPELLEEIEPTISVSKWDLVRDIVDNPKSDRQLVGVDLSDADLSGADLCNADLSNADLSGADLRSADFNRADLSGADLSCSNLRSITHINCDRALVRARDLTLALNRDLVRDSARARTLARDLTLTLARARARARALNSALDLDLDSDLDLARDLALAFDLALALALARSLVCDRDRDIARDIARDIHRSFNRAPDRDSARACALMLILIGANLRNANLSNTNVAQAHLGSGLGLSEAEKRDLAQRGAIFDESPSDRSPISSHNPIAPQ
jgi:uncharacterized protein YjbI with pentapeptide repeats